jgi:LAO/AO transport system kinase
VKPFFVYMLKCADGSYYVGHTDELDLRVAQHQSGSIPGAYTHERRPVELVWSQETATREEALAGEMRIKGWGRAKKESLIRGDWASIRRHAWGTKNPLPEELADAPASIPQPERIGVTTGSSADLTPEPALPPTPVRPEVSKGACQPQSPLPQRASALFTGVRSSTRRAIAKTITLLESTRPDHRLEADALLNALLPHTGKSLRLGISGVPGVGKSTFIEALGLDLIAKGHRVAVLTIDPSSSVSGGSILGDKTRMERLSVNDAAYIRPSPASGR